jgi:hypothetical protein
MNTTNGYVTGQSPPWPPETAKPDMRLTRAGNAAWSDGAARGYTQTLDISWV